jgi:hypothetical protein
MLVSSGKMIPSCNVTAVLRWADENPGKILIAVPFFYAAHRWEELSSEANIAPLLVTAALAWVAAYTWWRPVTLALLAWTSVFMFADGMLHLAAIFATQRYAPGVVTATILYIPMLAWLIRFLRTRIGVGRTVLAMVTVAFVLFGSAIGSRSVPW